MGNCQRNERVNQIDKKTHCWLPRERLQGTTSTTVVPVFFGRKISNVGGVNHKNKPAQRVPWRFLSLKKYKIVFFGPILLEL